MESSSAVRPVALHWDGTSFSTDDLPAPSDRVYLRDVSESAEGSIWAAGTYIPNSGASAEPIAEHFDGTTWAVSDLPGLRHGGQLSAVLAFTSSNVWVAGEFDTRRGTFPLLMHYDGLSWSRVDLGPQSGYLEDLGSSSPSDIWAVGSDFGGHVLVDHYDGVSWSEDVMAGVASGHASGVLDLGPDDVWIARHVYRRAKVSSSASHWDGSSWVESNMIPTGGSGAMYSIAGFSPDDLWAAGFRIVVVTHRWGSSYTKWTGMMKHWDGSKWSTVLIPTPGVHSYLGDISISSDGWGMAVGSSSRKSGSIRGLVLAYCQL